MTGKLGFIGGSGVYQIDGISIKREHEVDTPFGSPSGKVLECEFEGRSFFFVPRHGKDHSILPSEVNYRANVFALKKLGVKTIISISAVGSLKEELSPRMICLPDQFIDWTKGKRERTFFGEGMVGHVSTAYPIEKALQERLAEICTKNDISHIKNGSYICIEGPQFSSRAESEIYRGFGASVIGMTNVPEAYLAKEAGMAYATVALVTDYDCWKEEHCSVDEIMNVMKDNYQTAQTIVKEAVIGLNDNPVEFIPENKFALITAEERLTDKNKEILKVIME